MPDHGFPGLPAMAKLVLWNLSTHSENYTPSHQEIADWAQCSLREVNYCIPLLLKKGAIHPSGDYRKGQKRKWIVDKKWLSTTDSQSLPNSEPVQEVHTPYAGGAQVPMQEVHTPLYIEEKNKEKNKRRMPACNDPKLHAGQQAGRQAISNLFIVGAAKALEPYFFDRGKREATEFRLNYIRFNRQVGQMLERWGPESGQKMEDWFIETRDSEPVVFHVRNWQILENQIFRSEAANG
jgi:hypothetical protein